MAVVMANLEEFMFFKSAVQIIWQRQSWNFLRMLSRTIEAYGHHVFA